MSPLRLIFVASTSAVALVLAGGCGLDPGGAWNRTESGGGPIGSGAVPGASSSSGADATDQQQGLCPMSSTVLAGTKSAGDACTVPAECASTCCDCGTGTASWLSASCVAGKCVDSLTSCDRTRSRYCGGGAVVVTPPSSTAQCGNRSGTSTCDVCINANCCSAQLACDANTSCSALVSCDAACLADADCRQRCYTTHSAGTADLNTLDGCVAAACGAACEP
jgi:hypothetical protein